MSQSNAANESVSATGGQAGDADRPETPAVRERRGRVALERAAPEQGAEDEPHREVDPRPHEEEGEVQVRRLVEHDGSDVLVGDRLGAEPLPVERAEAEQERDEQHAEERQRPDDRLREAPDGHRPCRCHGVADHEKQERPDRRGHGEGVGREVGVEEPLPVHERADDEEQGAEEREAEGPRHDRAAAPEDGESPVHWSSFRARSRRGGEARRARWRGSSRVPSDRPRSPSAPSAGPAISYERMSP